MSDGSRARSSQLQLSRLLPAPWSKNLIACRKMSACKPSESRKLVEWLWILAVAVLLLNGQSADAVSPFRHLKGFASRGSVYSPSGNSIASSSSSFVPSPAITNPIPAASSVHYATSSKGVDPYISGSNSVDSAAGAAGAASAASAAAAVSQAATSLSNLAASASSNSYASDGYSDSHYASGSGSYGTTGGSYGAPAASYGASTGLASYGASGGIGASYGGGGSHGAGSYGGGGGGSYTTVTVPGSNPGLDKANALNFLSSLAPSLLLSSLLLPLALAILSNATGALGRRKRGVDSYFDDIDVGDQVDFELSFLDDNTLKAVDALVETLDNSPDQATEQQKAVVSFASQKGLLDTGNQCLERLACLSAEGSKTALLNSKEATKIRKALKWITSDGDTARIWKDRIDKSSKKGRKNPRVCLADFTCQKMTS